MLPAAASGLPVRSDGRVEAEEESNEDADLARRPSDLSAFVSEIERHGVPNFEVTEFAQPPHMIFFDGDQEVVRTIVVSPSWTGFELRDLVLENMER
ncbi:uncharacterized protein IUM83_16770 [Phytophthora cinnamomi]|uniref:uncharacterized protein n=1 Tax=Phytophthora cinnamomi TaxID=4785 RepID=UPI00355A22D4|nr:hypothetical protein IUM83_16770 [Phytophthora cinnamomi]